MFIYFQLSTLKNRFKIIIKDKLVLTSVSFKGKRVFRHSVQDIISCTSSFTTTNILIFIGSAAPPAVQPTR